MTASGAANHIDQRWEAEEFVMPKAKVLRGKQDVERTTRLSGAAQAELVQRGNLHWPEAPISERLTTMLAALRCCAAHRAGRA